MHRFICHIFSSVHSVETLYNLQKLKISHTLYYVSNAHSLFNTYFHDKVNTKQLTYTSQKVMYTAWKGAISVCTFRCTTGNLCAFICNKNKNYQSMIDTVFRINYLFKNYMYRSVFLFRYIRTM